MQPSSVSRVKQRKGQPTKSCYELGGMDDVKRTYAQHEAWLKQSHVAKVRHDMQLGVCHTWQRGLVEGHAS